jgi:hypothetical protein
MDKLKLVELILGLNSETKRIESTSESFLEVNKVYAFRTVTMIYTGRIKAISAQELLVDEAAWIPETERWMDFAATGAHKEAEPYTKPVVIMRGALLDATEIPSVIRKQK